MANIRKASDWFCVPDRSCGDVVINGDLNTIAGSINHFHEVGYTITKATGTRLDGEPYPVLGYSGSPTFQNKLINEFPIPCLYGYRFLCFYFNYATALNLDVLTFDYIYRTFRVKYWLNGNTVTLGEFTNEPTTATLANSGTVFSVVNIPRMVRPNLEQRQTGYLIIEHEITNLSQPSTNLGLNSYDGFNDFNAIAIR